MAEMAAFAMGTQFVSACISEPGKEIAAFNTAQSICDQIPIVTKQIQDVMDLRTAIATAKTVDADTSAKIIELNSEIGAKILSLKSEQKKFDIKLLISIVTNIIIVAIVGIFLFS
jgi:hypothetical protein